MIIIREVGPRDGLQSINKIIPTKEKIILINCLIESGIKEIEVTSFVSSKAVPQLQDAEEVVKNIERKPYSVISALVANLRGVERALKTKVDKLQYVISVSETHNKHNTNLSIEQSLKQLEEIVKLAVKERVQVKVALATAFGCSYEGIISYKKIYDLIQIIKGIGITDITLADTSSMIEIISYEEIIQSVKKDFPNLNFALHLHAPKGLGMDSILTAVENGFKTFESSIAGLGGCPFIPNAQGNIATEAIVTTLHLLGMETGIDLYKLKKCSSKVESILNNKIEGHFNLEGF